MRILGIDPGYAIVGYGIINYNCGKFSVEGYGAITTKAGEPFADRLASIYADLEYLIKKYKPEALAIEKLYFNTNTTTAIDVAQARGVIVLGAKNNGLEIYEYTPLQVKQSVTGYGRADKKQVQEMTRVLLGLDSVPKPDDTADALAIAICHAHSSGSIAQHLKV